MASDRLNLETARINALAERYPENKPRVLDALNAAARAIRNGDTPRHLAQRAVLDATDLLLALEAERVAWNLRRTPPAPAVDPLTIKPEARDLYTLALTAAVAGMSSPRLFVIPGADGMLDPDVMQRLAELTGPEAVAARADELATAVDRVAVLVALKASDRLGPGVVSFPSTLDRLEPADLTRLVCTLGAVELHHPADGREGFKVSAFGVLMGQGATLGEAAERALDDLLTWFPLRVEPLNTERELVAVDTADGRRLEPDPGVAAWDVKAAGAFVDRLAYNVTAWPTIACMEVRP